MPKINITNVKYNNIINNKYIFNNKCKLFIFFIITCKWGAICLIKGFDANSISSSVSSLYPEVIKRAMESSFASNKDVTRSFFDVPFWRLLSLESIT